MILRYRTMDNRREIHTEVSRVREDLKVIAFRDLNGRILVVDKRRGWVDRPINEERFIRVGLEAEWD